MTQSHRTLLLLASMGALVGLLSASAQAGAPGSLDSTGASFLVAPALRVESGPALSPAEIRNAVSIRMDELAAQGIAVDRASVDGIGLDGFGDTQMVEAGAD